MSVALVKSPTATLAELEFNAVPHTYHVRGREFRSVTTIMRAVGLGFQGNAPQEALNRGQYVHEACALLAENDLHWPSVPEKWLGYVRAYERFLLETGAKPVAAEWRFYHPELGYAGTLDQVVMRKALRVGVEIKTGDTTDVSVQASGYDRGWNYWQPGRPLDAWECLKLNDDATYRVTPLDIEAAWPDFVSALRVTHRIARGAGRI